MSLFAILVPAAAVSLAAPQADTQRQFDLIADAVTSAQTCEQIGFSVDRQGIVDWSLEAKADAMASGLSEPEAQTALEDAVREEYGRVLERFARAKIMDHAIDNVKRNNRNWHLRCEDLSKDPFTASYFSKA